jgi:hypothetical protein
MRLKSMKVKQRFVSDELTHFAAAYLKPEGLDAQYEKFVEIIKSRKLEPRWVPNGVRGKPGVWLDTERFERLGELVGASMVCFCDIPRDLFEIHTAKYSPFGIAFSKQFLVGVGARPVMYVPRGARYGPKWPPLSDVMRRLFEHHLSLQGRVRPEDFRYLEQLSLEFYGYVKLFKEATSDEDSENFYMEREWRVNGRVKFRFRDIAYLVVPDCYENRLRRDLRGYKGEIFPITA